MASPATQPADARELTPPGPESVLWQRAGDWRLVFLAGRSLLLQVAHPVVDAGVAQHSNYRNDPWARFFGTLDTFFAVIYGGPDGGHDAGAALRAIHKDIKGVDAAGRRYHALEPEAYHWVHATLVDGVVVLYERFGRPMTTRELDRYYGEMCDVGRLYGVRDRDMPPDWPSFRAYMDDFARDVLVPGEVFDDVLRTIAKPPPPPLLERVPAPVWRLARLPAARVTSLTTVGLLPPVLRERAGLRWTRANELELGLNAALIRAAFPLLPARVRMPPAARGAWLAAKRARARAEEPHGTRLARV